MLLVELAFVTSWVLPILLWGGVELDVWRLVGLWQILAVIMAGEILGYCYRYGFRRCAYAALAIFHLLTLARRYLWPSSNWQWVLCLQLHQTILSATMNREAYSLQRPDPQVIDFYMLSVLVVNDPFYLIWLGVISRLGSWPDWPTADCCWWWLALDHVLSLLMVVAHPTVAWAQLTEIALTVIGATAAVVFLTTY